MYTMSRDVFFISVCLINCLYEAQGKFLKDFCREGRLASVVYCKTTREFLPYCLSDYPKKRTKTALNVRGRQMCTTLSSLRHITIFHVSVDNS